MAIRRKRRATSPQKEGFKDNPGIGIPMPEIKKTDIISETGKKRKNVWKTVHWYRKRDAARYIIKKIPEIRMNEAEISFMLELFYVSNKQSVYTLMKMLKGEPIGKSDLISTDDSIEMRPVMHPGEEVETDGSKLVFKKMLSPRNARIIELVKSGVGLYEAALAAGAPEAAAKKIEYIVGYYSPKRALAESSKVSGLDLLWQKYWETIQERVEAAGISEDFVLSKYKKQIDFNVQTLFDDDGNLKKIKDLDPEIAKMITKIKVSQVRYLQKNQTETQTIDIELGNRDKALDAIAKLQKGIFEHTRSKTINHKHSGAVLSGKINVDNLSENQLDEILKVGMNQQETLLKSDAIDAEYTTYQEEGL